MQRWCSALVKSCRSRCWDSCKHTDIESALTYVTASPPWGSISCQALWSLRLTGSRARDVITSNHPIGSSLIHEHLLPTTPLMDAPFDSSELGHRCHHPSPPHIVPSVSLQNTVIAYAVYMQSLIIIVLLAGFDCLRDETFNYVCQWCLLPRVRLYLILFLLVIFSYP